MAETRGELLAVSESNPVESNCPFCDIKQFEERLIAEVDGFYVIATLGQITDGGYVLLFPKEHIPCMGALTREQTQKAYNIAKKICHALSVEYNLDYSNSVYPVTLFEHGIVGQTIKHAHLHFLPTVLNLTLRIKLDFSESRVEQLWYPEHLHEFYSKNPSPYLFWESGIKGNNKPRVCWNPPAPFQYLRTIAAEALKRSERANWRTMDPELDKRLWSDTVRRLKPYFV